MLPFIAIQLQKRFMYKIASLLKGFLLIIAIISTQCGNAITLYVKTNGNDNWSGTLKSPNKNKTDGPLASLAGARDRLRQIKQKINLNEPVLIIIGDGKYFVQKPIEFGPEDSGIGKFPVVYQAENNGKAAISGGRPIKGFEQWKNGIWRTFIPEVASNQWYFEQLFVNDARATRARTPNKFFSYLLYVKEEFLDGKDAKTAKRAIQKVLLREKDFKILANLQPQELKDVNFIVYHSWDITRRFISSLDTNENALITEGKPMKPWNPWKTNNPYCLENFLAALDQPGEWFLSRDGWLYYKPREKEKMETAEVFAPVSEKLITINGKSEDGKFVSNITFKGLKFEHSQWIISPGGFEPAQAAANLEAAIQIDDAKNIVFENCELFHIATYAIWFRKDCQNNTIRHCYFSDLGAGGIRIGETSTPKNEAMLTKNNLVENNILLHTGMMFPCAVVIWIGHSPLNQILHNEIGDAYYTGISVGWRWGYAESVAKSNVVAFNHVHHLGWGIMSDMGGIYTLGPSQGTVVTNNVFHDVYSYSYGGWGMYTDEGSTGILFENNLVYNTKSGNFHQHYGKENIVRNNILAFSKEKQLQASRAEEHLSFIFERNIVYYKTGKLLDGNWDKVQFIMASNCFYNIVGAEIKFVGKTLQQWQEMGKDKGSIIADPLFVDGEHYDFRLKRGSPVFKLGFKPFDYSKAGVYGDKDWIKRTKINYPPLEIAPPPAD